MVNNCIFAFPFPPFPPLRFFVFVSVGPIGREITNRFFVKDVIFWGILVLLIWDFSTPISDL